MEAAMSTSIISKGSDGFYHPSSEEELAALVKQAGLNRKKLRVRGAAHSVGCAIYANPCGEKDNHVDKQTPPPGDDYNVMLDQYRGMRVIDREKRLVEVDAGINLGLDPSDPTGTSTLEN